MENTRFPEEFIKIIKTLYGSAKTSVMVNGVVPKPISIERGGDPISCLLYNLAIEPLANLIKKSNIKEGIKIDKKKENLKISLYADDTIVYLREKDSMQELERIIERFC